MKDAAPQKEREREMHRMYGVHPRGCSKTRSASDIRISWLLIGGEETRSFCDWRTPPTVSQPLKVRLTFGVYAFVCQLRAEFCIILREYFLNWQIFTESIRNNLDFFIFLDRL